MNVNVQHDTDKNTFYAINDGKVSTLDYEPMGDKKLDYKSTFVPEEQRNQGIAGALVRHALEYAEKKGYQVRPSCPFVRSYIEKHPRFQEITSS